MTDTEIIMEFIRDELLDDDEEEIDEQTPLFSSQLLDSLGVTSLILAIEEKFGVRVAPMDISYDNFDTVERIVAFVARKRNGDG